MHGLEEVFISYTEKRRISPNLWGKMFEIEKTKFKILLTITWGTSHKFQKIYFNKITAFMRKVFKQIIILSGMKAVV